MENRLRHIRTFSWKTNKKPASKKSTNEQANNDDMSVSIKVDCMASESQQLNYLVLHFVQNAIPTQTYIPLSPEIFFRASMIAMVPLQLL